MKSSTLRLATASVSTALPFYASAPDAVVSGSALRGYDAYYDNAHGPSSNGYWGGGSILHDDQDAGRLFVRNGHFPRRTAGGFHGVRANGVRQ